MVNKEEAKKYLSDCPEQNSFWVNDGNVLKNLDQLMDELKHINDVTFHYHVNENKNDFSNWINDIIGDHYLAKELHQAKTKSSALKKLKERLSSLKKRAM